MTQSRKSSRVLPLLLGAAICASAAAAADLPLLIYEGSIRNETNQNAYQLVVDTAKPIYSTILALPLNRYQVLDNSVGGSHLTFVGAIPVFAGRALSVFWVVNRAAPSNILSYRWADKRGNPIGAAVVALRFETDSSGMISVVNPSNGPLTYANLRGGVGVQITGPALDTVEANSQKTVALVTANAGDPVDLSLEDPHCGVIFYYR